MGIEKLMKQTNAESLIVPIQSADLERFEKIAKQFGVLFAAVESEDKNNGVAHIVSNVNYSAQLNAVMEAMGYPVLEAGKEETAAKKAKARAPQEKSSDERGTGLNQQRTDEKPSVRQKLRELDAVAKAQSKAPPVRGRDIAR